MLRPGAGSSPPVPGFSFLRAGPRLHIERFVWRDGPAAHASLFQRTGFRIRLRLS
jgi:hypothetical protein